MACDPAQFPLSVKGFEAEVRGNWGAICRQPGNPGRSFKKGAAMAHAIYRKTYHSPLPFIVIGAGQIRDNIDLKGNFGIIDASVPKGAKGRFDPQGAIFGGQWCWLFNDMFMIAAANRGKEIIMTHEVMPSIDQLWDDQKKVFTSLGRELAIAMITGYCRGKVFVTKNISGPVSFKRPCLGEAKTFTYKQVTEALSQIKTQHDAKALLFQEPAE